MPSYKVWTGSGLSIMVIATFIALGCASSEGEESGKAASQKEESRFQIASPNFTEIRPKKRIPKENTCWGENMSPPLNWSGEPAATKSFALIAEDIDHHTGTPWIHWILYNIPASTTELIEGIPTSTPELIDGSVQGLNDFKNIGYEGPCPIKTTISFWGGYEGRAAGGKDSNPGPHKYVFTLYALDTVISLPAGSTKQQLLDSMNKHILDQVDTVGKFQMSPTTDLKKDLSRDTPTPTKR